MCVRIHIYIYIYIYIYVGLPLRVADAEDRRRVGHVDLLLKLLSRHLYLRCLLGVYYSLDVYDRCLFRCRSPPQTFQQAPLFGCVVLFGTYLVYCYLLCFTWRHTHVYVCLCLRHMCCDFRSFVLCVCIYIYIYMYTCRCLCFLFSYAAAGTSMARRRQSMRSGKGITHSTGEPFMCHQLTCTILYYTVL